MSKAKILIVEDEVIIAMEIENSLQMLGYDVTSKVDNGKDAIKKAEADKPDLILMDIRIKGDMDGIEAAETIRTRFGIPIIFSTAYLDEKRIQRAKITMPFGYVLKPIQERELKITLEMALFVARVDSERRRTESKLRDSLQFSTDIIESSPSGLFIYQFHPPDSLILLKSNPEAQRLTGIDIENSIGMEFNEIWPEAQQSGITDAFLQTAKTGRTYEIEDQTYEDDKLSGAFRVRAFSMPGNKLGVAFENITSRKEVENALEESQFLFSQMFAQSNISTQLFNPEGYCINVNMAFCELYGVQRHEITGGQYNIFEDKNLMTPRILPLVRQVFEHKQSNSWDGNFDIEASSEITGIPTAKRETMFLDVFAYPILDEQGDLRYVVLQTYDITNRKNVEDALKASEKRLNDLILCSVDWVWEVDRFGRFTYVSDKIEQILGYRQEEVIQKTPFDLMTPEESTRLEKVFNEMTGKKLPIVNLENWNLAKDGKKVCLLTNGLPILDQDNNLIGYRGVAKDITAFKNIK